MNHMIIRRLDNTTVDYRNILLYMRSVLHVNKDRTKKKSHSMRGLIKTLEECRNDFNIEVCNVPKNAKK